MCSLYDCEMNLVIKHFIIHSFIHFIYQIVYDMNNDIVVELPS